MSRSLKIEPFIGWLRVWIAAALPWSLLISMAIMAGRALV